MCSVVRTTSLITLFFCLSVISNMSHADAGDQYLLPKVGSMSVDLNNANALSSIGLLYGYGINPEWTVEGELNSGVSGGEYDRVLGSGTRLEGEYTVWTLAGYAVYRYPVIESVFLKAKLGVLYENIERDGTQTIGSTIQVDDNNSKGFGAAGGIGIGFLVKRTILELEITGIDEDIIYYSLGINFTF